MLKGLYHIGNYWLMLVHMFRNLEKVKVYWNASLIEIVDMGIGSVFIVFITSLFVGAVTTIQTAYQLESGLFPTSIIGYVVSTTALLEMAPTVTCLILAGKIGSNISTHLGTMRISEQIDAIEVMGINSASFLILPKIVSALFSFPALVIVAAFLIHLGGIIAGELTGEISYALFTEGLRKYHDPYYVTFMLIKAVTFGFIVASVSAYQGYYVKGGAVEVGQASTRAVVISCIAIVGADYLLAQLLL